MAPVMLRAPLSELCGGRLHAIAGATVGEVLVALEREHPPIAGWGPDQRGRIRGPGNGVGHGSHRGGGGVGGQVNVVVKGSRGEEGTRLAGDDRVHVLPAITGG